MLRSRPVACALATLALIAAVGAPAAPLSYQEIKRADRSDTSEKTTQAPITAAARSPDAPRTSAVLAAVIRPLPPRAELHQLLRRAATDAVAIARANPKPSSWCLTTIATAQAKASDLDAARQTFAYAATEAEGGFGGNAHPWNLWRIGHFQAESGLKQQARLTLHRAVRVLPGVTGDFGKDSRAVDIFTDIVKDLAGIGAREDARKTFGMMLEFSKTFFESTHISNVRDVEAPDIGSALAAVGDFDAAFEWCDGGWKGSVLGQIAIAASENLDPKSARRFVDETAARLAKLRWANETYFGLSDLAEAQARLGDVETAKRSAKSIGNGPSRANDDMTDGQPYALTRVANVQLRAGDLAGARETLRDAFRVVKKFPTMRGRDGRLMQIASAQIAAGDIDGAIETANAIEGNRSATLALIGRAQAGAGRDQEARATYARALANAGQAVKDPPPPNPELLKMPGVSQNMPASTLANLAEIQAMAGDVSGALKTLRSIDSEVYTRTALQRIVAARATAGDVAGALRLALDESKTPDERRSALEGLGVTTRFSLPLGPAKTAPENANRRE